MFYLKYFFNLLKNQLGIIPYPSFVTFIVTWRCNERCVMCDIWKKRMSYEVTADEIDTIFSQLKSLDVIRITGGEPFLRDDLAEIINIINKRVNPRTIYITTNGTLTEKIMAFMKDVKTLRNVRIKISIDALEEEHNRIRGDKESYSKAISTLSLLSGLKQKYGFYLGVNQTIVSQKCLNDYNGLQEVCSRYNVKLYPALACSKPPLYEPDNYSDSSQRKNRIGVFGNFSHRQIIEMFNMFKKSFAELDNFAEKIAEKYYLKGLYYRLLYGKNYPNPRCVALRDHLRILPNGDVPVCLYNPDIVGNLLRKANFEKFWFENENVKKYRQEAWRCSGCWAKCEIVPSGVYTGDIIKTIFRRA